MGSGAVVAAEHPPGLLDQPGQQRGFIKHVNSALGAPTNECRVVKIRVIRAEHISVAKFSSLKDHEI